SMAYEAGRIGGSMPTVFNAANEYAVSRFLHHEIAYLTITDMIEKAMRSHHVIFHPTVEQILETEQETYDRLKSGI
ncbi:MAG: 1-deoxy-D-xylulose-5-phosphate reductoisomerase, partial [Hungatella sp.]